jgi:branched-chain amino acid transport system substrate-binding protein
VNDHEIRVGLSVSISGKFQLQGQQALNGIRLWLSHVNAQGGIHIGRTPRSVRLIWYDDNSRASNTRENVLRLLRGDRVHILLGPYSSSLTMLAAEIAEEHKKILWNYGGTSNEIFGQGWQYVIGISSPASDYFRTLPRWLVDKHHEFSRICVLYSSKGSFAWQVACGVMESAQQPAQPLDLVPFDNPLKNGDVVISRLFDLGPEAVLLAGNFQDELAIMRTRPHWPTTVRTTAAVAAGIASFASHLGEMAEGVLGPSQWEPDMNLPTILGPSSDWFVSSFQRQFGTAPDYIAAGAFATGLIVAECIRQAGSMDDRKLRSMASDLDLNTFYGRFRIDARSGEQLDHRVVLIQWQNGTKTVLPC